MSQNSLALLLLVLLLAIAISILFFLAYKYFSVKGQIGELVRKEFELWRTRELHTIKQESLEAARREMQFEFEQWKLNYERSIRQDAIQKSQAVTLGKVTEHFIPYLPDFSYNPKDARFIGSPIDFIVFDGLNDGDVKKVVFIEVKTGSSALSSRERRIRDAIQTGQVEWIELRPAIKLGETPGKNNKNETEELANESTD